MWAQLPRQFLSHLLMLKCIICCIIILNYAATTEIVCNYTKWAGVQCVNGIKLTYFAYGTPAACKMARVFFLLIDLCEGGEWNSCQPLPSNMFVSFFFSLKYQYFFCVCMCRPTPPYFLSHLCMLLFYFIFSKAWTHTVSVVNGENLKDANSVCFCLVVSRHHQKEDTLHAMQVVVYYFYLPLKKKKIERNKCGSLMAWLVCCDFHENKLELNHKKKTT